MCERDLIGLLQLEWEMLFPVARVHNHMALALDHRPILLKLNKQERRHEPQ